MNMHARMDVKTGRDAAAEDARLRKAEALRVLEQMYEYWS